VADGVAQIGGQDSIRQLLEAYVWEPEYLPYERVRQ
jgi:hypothetical protein